MSKAKPAPKTSYKRRDRLSSDIEALLQALDAEQLSPSGQQAVKQFRQALHRSVGQPRVPVTRAQIEKELKTGKSMRQVAAHFGVAVNTVRRRLGLKA
jgi:DNA-directed RNA polymerase specialized sigma24 family protein